MAQSEGPSSAASSFRHHGSTWSHFKHCVLSALSTIGRSEEAQEGGEAGLRREAVTTQEEGASEGQTPATVLGGRAGVVLIFFSIILLFSNFSLMNRYYFHTQKNMCFVLRDKRVKGSLLPLVDSEL